VGSSDASSRGGGLQRVQQLGRCSGDGAVRWMKGTTNVMNQAKQAGIRRRERERETRTLNTAKRASQKTKDVRDPDKQAQISAKATPADVNLSTTGAIFFLFPIESQGRSLFCCRRQRRLCRECMKLHSSISTLYGLWAVLQSDWLLAQGGLCKWFWCNDPTRSRSGVLS